MRCLVDQPLAAFRSTPEPYHVRLREGFVDEHELRRIQLRLFLAQGPPRLGDVGPILFGRVHDLFLNVRPRPSNVCQIRAMLASTPYARSNHAFSSSSVASGKAATRSPIRSR